MLAAFFVCFRYLLLNTYQIMKYIKLFENHSDYEAYMDSNEYVTPNLSCCRNEDNVHSEEGGELVAVYGVGPYVYYSTRLFGSIANIETMEIDGVLLDKPVESYYFPSHGSDVPTVFHTVKCKLKDPTYLESRMFYNVSTITELRLPDTIKIVGSNLFKGSAFYNNSDRYRPSIIRVSNLETFLNLKYGDVNSLLVSAQKINVSENGVTVVREVPTSLYVGGNEVKDVVIPEGVESMCLDAFCGWSWLESITIPSTLKDISHLYPQHIAFYGCDGLKSAFVNSDNVYFDSRDGYNGIIFTKSDEIILGISKNIPNTVKRIGDYAMHGTEWNSATSITIPDSVVTIGNDNFKKCTNLTTLTLGENVAIIGTSTQQFVNCPLTSITSYALNPPVLPTSGPYPFTTDTYNNCVLYVPASAISDYQNDYVWSHFQNIQAIP